MKGREKKLSHTTGWNVDVGSALASHSLLTPLSPIPPFRFPLPATTRLYRVKTHKRFLSSLRFWKQSNNRKLDEAAGEEGSQEEPRKK